MGTNKRSTRQALAGAASVAAGALTGPAVAVLPKPVGERVSSPPIGLRGRIIGRPICETSEDVVATHFVVGRVTGYTTFKLEQNAVLEEFLLAPIAARFHGKKGAAAEGGLPAALGESGALPDPPGVCRYLC